MNDQPTTIYFIEAQASECPFFEEQLKNCDLRFVAKASEIERNAEILSVYIHTRVDVEFLTNHPCLQFVTTRSVGYDHIDVEECRRRNVTVCNAPGSDANTVAEHTFALILAVARRLQEVREANKQPHFSYEQFRGIDLKGKTIGIIGTGRIGLRTIHIALAFGMRVLAYDPYQRALMAEILGVHYVSLEELLRRSHVVSLHAPLTSETHHLLNREALALCRRGVIIINTARGGLIDTEALVDALDHGDISGVGIDVLEEESVMQRPASRIIAEDIIRHLHAHSTPEELRMRDPDRVKHLESLMRNQKLLTRANVVFTPHVAFNSVEAVERINGATVENIRGFLFGTPVNVVSSNSIQEPIS